MMLFNGAELLEAFATQQEDGTYIFDEIQIDYTTVNVGKIRFGLSQAYLKDDYSGNIEDVKNWEVESQPYTDQESLDDLPLVIENGVLKVRRVPSNNNITTGMYNLWLLGTTLSGKEVNTTIFVMVKKRKITTTLSSSSFEDEFLI